MTNPNRPPLQDDSANERLVTYSDIYYGAFGGEKIVVAPSENPKGPSEEHIEALAAAQRRIGHLTRAFRNLE